MELTLKNLRKQYGSKTAADDISIVLKPGVYGLLGANGAGKTTLMRMICGILRPTSGEILADGRPIEKLGEKYYARLGYMPQHFGFYPDFTAREFLLYMAAVKGLDKRTAGARTDELLKTVNLSDVADKKIRSFSGGMKQRLLAAASVMGHPQILIMDEPMAGLDPKERVHLRNVLKEISKDAIVLVATHVVPDIETVADKILILKEGELHDIGTPQELIERYESDTGMEGVYLRIFGEDDADETC